MRDANEQGAPLYLFFVVPRLLIRRYIYDSFFFPQPIYVVHCINLKLTTNSLPVFLLLLPLFDGRFDFSGDFYFSLFRVFFGIFFCFESD